MTQLQGILNTTHPYMPLYKHALQIMKKKPLHKQQDVTVKLWAERNRDQKTHNLPTAKHEIIAIILGDGSEEKFNYRDIV